MGRKKDNGRADALLIGLWHENTQLGSHLMGGEGETAPVSSRVRARVSTHFPRFIGNA